MTDFAALRPKIYSYLTGNNDENKKGKDTKKCFRKWKIKLEDYKHCLEVTQRESTKYKIKGDMDSLRVNYKELTK